MLTKVINQRGQLSQFSEGIGEVMEGVADLVDPTAFS